MKSYATHLTVLICFAIVGWRGPEIVRAFREPVGPVQPVPVVNTFETDLRTAFERLSKEDQQVFRDHALSMVAFCNLTKVQHTDEALERIGAARMEVYGAVDPMGERDEELNAVLNPECVKRGMLAADADNDGKPDNVTAFDPAVWGEFYREVGAAIN